MKDTLENYIVEDRGYDTPCHIYQGAINEYGYAVVGIKGKRFMVHRLSWERANNAAMPKNLDTDHLCRQHDCINPDHLEPVTRKENIRRGVLSQVQKERHARVTHCPKGHEYNEENTYVSKAGTRGCLTCRREASRIWNAKIPKKNS